MNYWLIKSDPQSYGWENMKQDNSTSWDGIRNFQARNYLNQMKKGDKALFYHSNEKAIKGIVEIVSEEAFRDPTSDDPRWLAVKVEFDKELNNSVALDEIKEDQNLSEIPLLKQSRLSVMPLTKDEYNEILKLGK
jgi:predicted RNA-binding protein with PUA-like domain